MPINALSPTVQPAGIAFGHQVFNLFGFQRQRADQMLINQKKLVELGEAMPTTLPTHTWWDPTAPR